MKLTNLIEAKKQTERLTKEYGSDHDFEIGSQRYYQFLITDFYTFIKGIQEKYRRGDLPDEYLNDIEDFSLEIPMNYKASEFISIFIGSNQLGKTTYYVNESSVKITFGEISLDELTTAFYEELQRIEYYMKSSEEMKLELQEFIRNNPKYLEMKRGKNQITESFNSMVEDEKHYDEYYRFLNTLYNKICPYFEDENWFKKYRTEGINKIDWHFNSYTARDCVINFLEFYKLGFYQISLERATFESSPKEIKTAYFQEMQRLEQFGPKKTLKQ